MSAFVVYLHTQMYGKLSVAPGKGPLGLCVWSMGLKGHERWISLMLFRCLELHTFQSSAFF